MTLGLDLSILAVQDVVDALFASQVVGLDTDQGQNQDANGQIDQVLLTGTCCAFHHVGLDLGVFAFAFFLLVASVQLGDAVEVVLGIEAVLER